MQKKRPIPFYNIINPPCVQANATILPQTITESLFLLPEQTWPDVNTKGRKTTYLQLPRLTSLNIHRWSLDGETNTFFVMRLKMI